MERLSRRQQRIWTLQALYEADFCGLSSEEALANLTEREPDALRAEYAQKLIPTILGNLQEIDAKIKEHSIDWSLDRMSRVDLSILRIAVGEMIYVEDVVDSVAINEAIELAKEFSTPKSSKFINGVLGALSQSLTQGGKE